VQNRTYLFLAAYRKVSGARVPVNTVIYGTGRRPASLKLKKMRENFTKKSAGSVKQFIAEPEEKSIGSIPDPQHWS
jgi:hypothetical protein